MPMLYAIFVMYFIFAYFKPPEYIVAIFVLKGQLYFGVIKKQTLCLL